MASAGSPPAKRFRKARSYLSTSSAASVERADLIHQVLMLFYSEIEERFAATRVLVDGNNEVPSHVWYQRREEKYAVGSRMYQFTMELGEPEKDMELYIRKWCHPKGRNDAYIKLANLHVDELAKQLHFADQEWLASRKSSQPDPVAVKNLLGVLGCTYNDAVPGAFLREVSGAFCHFFHNSRGREGLRVILSMAGKAAFGVDFPYYSTEAIFSIGTSQYRKEGLPVQNFPRSPAHETYDLRSKSPQSENGSVRSSKISSSDACAMIYCDMLVTSVDKNSWTKFLLVNEVKSGFSTFTGAEVTQIVQQMVALCMHQTEIFGLLINGGSAQLFGLTHDPIKKQLTCSRFKTFEYQFKSRVGNDALFNTASFKNFLRDLVAVLDYAKENIRKVELQLDPL